MSTNCVQSSSPDAKICHLAIKSEVVQLQAGYDVDVWLSQHGGLPDGPCLKFSIPPSLEYFPFCDDFGPMNLLSIVRFSCLLEEKIDLCSKAGSKRVVLLAEKGQRALTNAAFLLGSYMLLKLNMHPDAIWDRFKCLDRGLFEEYRDATFSEGDFRLSLLDCWRGLQRGKEIGWISRPSQVGDPFWGEIDIESYEHYDNPFNADMHEVVPELFVAFRGPKDLGGQEYRNDPHVQHREFAPEYYIDIFKDIGVSTVVRLNEIEYRREAFEDHGIKHVDLYFDDCTSPSLEVVHAFFDIVENASGLVAVHCKAGLGRTGTLIALYMMRKYGFTAREAIGWLRIMRSGCVIGIQQHFLCEVERLACQDKSAKKGHALKFPSREALGIAASNGKEDCPCLDCEETPKDAPRLRTSSCGCEKPCFNYGSDQPRVDEPDVFRFCRSSSAALAEQVSEALARRSHGKASYFGTSIGS